MDSSNTELYTSFTRFIPNFGEVFVCEFFFSFIRFICMCAMEGQREYIFAETGIQLVECAHIKLAPHNIRNVIYLFLFLFASYITQF